MPRRIPYPDHAPRPASIAICDKCGQYVHVDAAGQAERHESYDGPCDGQAREMTAEEARMLGNMAELAEHDR